MVNKPSVNDFNIAAQWLDVYEGEVGDENVDACKRVRMWIIEQSEKIEFKEACKSAGVSLTEAKKALAASKKKTRGINHD